MKTSLFLTLNLDSEKLFKTDRTAKKKKKKKDAEMFLFCILHRGQFVIGDFFFMPLRRSETQFMDHFKVNFIKCVACEWIMCPTSRIQPSAFISSHP